MTDQTFHCLALTLVPGLGRSRILGLLRRFEQPERILRMSRADLEQLNLSFEVQAFIVSGCALKAAEQALQAAQERGWRILSPFEIDYPSLLREIYDPPPILYCLGDIELLSRPAVSIVGSRRCSVYGRQLTHQLARELASRGLVIVSGLARGIDSVAHQGCLKADGKTVAVLGNGLDVIYPKQNRRLYRQIADQGCLTSEFPAGHHPAPQNFPIRNRIISGLSFGTLVTEAAKNSGSLITARSALRQNREVWALPGNVTSRGSYGPNLLIRQGAHPVSQSEDLIENLPPYVREIVDDLPQEAPAALLQEDLSDGEAKVLKLLSGDASLPFDRIAQDSGLSASELNQILFSLEMKDLVDQAPGRQFNRKLH